MRAKDIATIRREDSNQFRPFVLEIRVDDLESLAYLWARFNMSTQDVIDRGWMKMLPECMKDAIEFGRSEDGVVSQAAWRLLENEVRRLDNKPSLDEEEA